MSHSKIEIKVGIVEFSSEGEQDWVTIQVDKFLGKVPELLKFNSVSPIKKNESTGGANTEPSGSTITPSKNSNLASWLKEKGATTNQVKKFLATAAFLQTGGKHRLTTADIIAALKNSNQSKLGNAADNLNANVKKGHCEKDGNEFFVTTEGLEQLSIKQWI